jgi:general secretion pathway protein F
VPVFQYRALSQGGEVVKGSIDAAGAVEANRGIEALGLFPIEAVAAVQRETTWQTWRFLPSFSRPRPEDVTVFTADLALLLRTGVRINEALELLVADPDMGRLRSTTAALTTSILSGESFGEALSRHPTVFPKVYVALARVGETSGALVSVLESLSVERQRAEILSRRLYDTLRYPAFLLLAAGAVLLFFLLFVLPQFANVFRDFNAKLDPVLVTFLGLSDLLRTNGQAVGAAVLVALLAGWLAFRQRFVRETFSRAIERMPMVGPILTYKRSSLFCRNLSLLLSSGVTLVAALRIIADTMEAGGATTRWSLVVDKVRRGGKLSDALSQTAALPSLAIRTVRLGEDSSQLPMLMKRIADYYEAKLQRSLDHAIGLVGPIAIVLISTIVGGLIVSVMTALISVNQSVG